MMRAKERLYLTADKDQLVPAGHPKAAFLYAVQGDEIPDSAAERFGLVDGLLKRGKRSSGAETLLGSSILPGEIEIAPGKSVQLGRVVVQAHKASGLSVEDWNALSEADRETRLAQEVEVLKAEAAMSPKPAKGKVAPVRKPKATAATKEAPTPENKETKPDENKSGGGAAENNAGGQ